MGVLQTTLTRLYKLQQVSCSFDLLDALFRHKVLASTEHSAALAYNLRIVVDIGANRGQFALVARHRASKARVISFEPLSVPSERFRQIFTGDERVTLHQVAIGPYSGKATIHVSKMDDSSSLLPIGAAQNRLFPGTDEKGAEVVRVGSLDEFLSPDDINPPAILKIDVQGFELEALKGCESLLEKFDYVYAECSFLELYEEQALADDVISWLRDRGFVLSGVYNMSYDYKGKAVQGDFLFMRRAF